MVDTIKQIEAVPTAYPAAPAGLSADAQALDPNAIWQRIESYIAHRWSDREVIWTVEGEGEWQPPLTPTTITTAEKWELSAWVSVTLQAGPYGYCLLSDGPYRITADVGGGDVPAAVSQAFIRLAEYLAKKDASTFSGASSESVSVAGGSVSLSATRNPAWVARAIQNSGAADLLRPYRRA